MAGKLPVDQGAIVEHKRLSHALQVAQALQAQRDNRRIGKAPSRTHLGATVRTQQRSPGTKKPHEFTQADVEQVIARLAQQNLPAITQLDKRKSRRLSARALA
jgi:hypothetical protein